MNADIPEATVLRELEAASMRMAKGAGDILSRYAPGDTRVSFKGKGETDPVTEADLRVEEYLREAIYREFPDHAIVGEEDAKASGDSNADFIWAVDPLDGTANFAGGLPFYAVSIGLMYLGKPVVGSLYLPSTAAGEGIYHARTGGGAFGDETPLHVSTGILPQPSGLAGVPASLGHTFVFEGRRGEGVGELRIMGSIACEMVLVARGILQFSLLTGSHIWDVAAGIVLIREAGGEVLEWRKGRWEPFQEFVTPSRKADETYQQALRRWGVPLLTGNPEMATHMASRTKARRRPLSVFWRKLKAFRSSGQ